MTLDLSSYTKPRHDSSNRSNAKKSTNAPSMKPPPAATAKYQPTRSRVSVAAFNFGAITPADRFLAVAAGSPAQELGGVTAIATTRQPALRLNVFCIDSGVTRIAPIGPARSSSGAPNSWPASSHTGQQQPTEAINLLIKKILPIGHGLRNSRNNRLRLLLRCGITWQNHAPIPLRGRLPRLAAQLT